MSETSSSATPEPTSRCQCGGRAQLTEATETGTTKDGRAVTYQMPFYRCSKCGDEYLTRSVSTLATERFTNALRELDHAK